MSTKTNVLSALESRRGDYVSGQELAETLNRSRTAVWKAVKTLREDGHGIVAVTNRGYSLLSGSDLLSEEGLRAALPERYKNCPITVLRVTDSTNTQTKKCAVDGAPHGTLLLAEEQTAGRGRYGKTFFSPYGAGLYMSLLLKPAVRDADLQMITVAAANAVCTAIEKLTQLEPKIKWVNDIYLDGKKICGILTEAVTDFETGSVESIIVGVGVDCAIDQSTLPEELRGIVGSIGKERISRNQLAAEIASGILDSFHDLSDRAIIDLYRKKSMMIDREIYFMRGGQRFQARVTGISDSGALLVRLPSGEETALTSGEVSIGSLSENMDGGPAG